MQIDNPNVELLWITPDCEKMIELAARVCYNSEPKTFEDCPTCKGSGIRKLLNCNPVIRLEAKFESCIYCEKRSSEEIISKLLNMKHLSVLEHASASFKLICSRACAQQITRHRLFSYSMQSQRYCNYSNDKYEKQITFINQDFENDKIGDCKAKWIKSCELSESYYFDLIDCGCKPEEARMSLNNSCKTELVMTGNFRSWLNFLELRTSTKSQKEIRFLSSLIAKKLDLFSPTIFGKFVETSM